MDDYIYDFSVVRDSIRKVDPASPKLNDLGIWARALAEWKDDPNNWALSINDNFAPIVTWVIGFVGAMDPLMLERFQEYARPVLSEERYAEFVTNPQVAFDFGQLALSANSEELILEIRILRDKVIAGNRLAKLSDLSPEMRDFYPQFFDTNVHRPRLCARVSVYFALLMPGDPGQGDDGPDLDAGGIAADLLLPSPIS